MPDSVLEIWSTKFDNEVSEQNKAPGLTHERGHTLGIADHYPSANPDCRDDVLSIMENWGCDGTTTLRDPHDTTDFQWAYRITAHPGPTYLHPAGAPGHSLNPGTAELHIGGAGNIHNEKHFWNHTAPRRTGTPSTEQISSGPNITTLIVSIPSATAGNNNVGVCKRSGASTGTYGSSLLGVGPPSNYACIKYGENLSASGTKPKYYVETDTVGNTVHVYVYNVGSVWLYHVNVDDTGTFNLKCTVTTTAGIGPGNVRSCSFTATADGTVDVWSLHVGSPTSEWRPRNATPPTLGFGGCVRLAHCGQRSDCFGANVNGANPHHEPRAYANDHA